jgi:hypothetical protein
MTDTHTGTDTDTVSGVVLTTDSLQYSCAIVYMLSKLMNNSDNRVNSDNSDSISGGDTLSDLKQSIREFVCKLIVHFRDLRR